MQEAWRLVEEFTEIFPDRFYLEMQRHGIGLQDQVNAELVKMASDLALHVRRVTSGTITRSTHQDIIRTGVRARSPAIDQPP